MNCLIIIISVLLLIFSYGHIPSISKYNITAITLFYLVLIILIFTKVSLYFMFRKKFKTIWILVHRRVERIYR